MWGLDNNSHYSSFRKFRLPLSAWHLMSHWIEQSGFVVSRFVRVLMISTSSFRTSKTCLSFCYRSGVTCKILKFISLNYLIIELPLFTKREVYPCISRVHMKKLKNNKMMQMLNERIVDIVFHITFIVVQLWKLKKV